MNRTEASLHSGIETSPKAFDKGDMMPLPSRPSNQKWGVPTRERWGFLAGEPVIKKVELVQPKRFAWLMQAADNYHAIQKG